MTGESDSCRDPIEIRCFDCVYFKPVGRGYTGWCQDAKPKIKVDAVDFCKSAKKADPTEIASREAKIKGS